MRKRIVALLGLISIGLICCFFMAGKAGADDQVVPVPDKDPRLDPRSNEYIYKGDKEKCEKEDGVWHHPVSRFASFSGGCKFYMESFINGKSYRWFSGVDNRKGLILSSNGSFISLWAQQAQDHSAIVEWEAVSNDYQVTKKQGNLLMITMRNVNYKTDISRSHLSFRGNEINLEIEKINEEQIKVRILNPEILVSPFPLGEEYLIFNKDRIVY